MKATELLEFLREIYRDRLTLRNRHVAAAAHVADYNFNNTYQYVVNRADGHVRWLQDAIEEALYRMEKGTYGICRDCGEPIAPARLNAIPWTRVCITCKEKQSS